MRRASAVALSVVLVLGTVLAFAPAFFASRRMRTFCAAIVPGTPWPRLREQAEAARYGVSPLAHSAFLVEHPSSMGRAYCIVRVEKDAVTSASPAQ